MTNLKGYVVTLLNLPESVEAAKRCVASGKQFGVDVEIFPAVDKTIALEEMEKEQLRLSSVNARYSVPEAVVGNFISQYRIWKKISDSGEVGIVLEHDAVFVRPIPPINDESNIINIGKSSYGFDEIQTKLEAGIYPLFSKQAGHFPGAHGYYVTPRGANILMRKAKRFGIEPCDIFLSRRNFPGAKELYPWVVEARDDFTTIQKEAGCEAKHNYNEKYRILS